jgi:hypothetical protein
VHCTMCHKTKKNGGITRMPWTKDDLKTLKAHSKAKTPVAKISKENETNDRCAPPADFQRGVSSRASALIISS